MNDTQIWSIVAVMAAGLASMITLTFRYVGARFDAIEARFSGKLDRLEVKFDAKFDHLDRDMQRVIERIFPIN